MNLQSENCNVEALSQIIVEQRGKALILNWLFVIHIGFVFNLWFLHFRPANAVINVAQYSLDAVLVLTLELKELNH